MRAPASLVSCREIPALIRRDGSNPGTLPESSYLMPSLPSGTVTFLFTDIEGSTRLLQQLGDQYAQVLSECRHLLRTAFQERGGHEIDARGEEFFVAFSRARDALATAVAAQRAVAAHPWPEGITVGIRMGLHTGEPLGAGTGYVGMDVHRAARICAAGYGGQILLTQPTRDLVVEDLPEGVHIRDLGEHRLKDLGRPHRLFQVVAPNLRADFPPLKSLDALPHNLPIHLTSFIGREREIAELKRLLSQSRLLTLTGLGGTGKTRLALQVAADVLLEYHDGVWFVDLAALSDPTLVPQSVASVLTVREQPGRPLESTLADHLQSRQVLLVVDNCEHLIRACATLADTLLRACPDLRICATSREALSVSGEVLYSVPPLSLPDAKQLLPEVLPRFDATRLFIERAILSRPDFTVHSRNAHAVAEICRRLDGLPLAIELAAARVKVLSPEQIVSRLDDRFRLLTKGGRTTLPRHQTLQAAIDWSYDLLAEKEQMLLRRMSVFAGGFTLEALEAVCSGDFIETHEVLGLLAQLVDKSLVTADPQNGSGRYRLLETVRQYGQEKLSKSGEVPERRRRHRDWFLDMAERLQDAIRGPEQDVWLNLLSAEHDNFRAALAWSSAEYRAEEGLRLAVCLTSFWYVRGHSSEGRTWLDTTLSRSDRVPASLRAKGLYAAGLLATGQGAYTEARPLHEESLRIFRELGDRQGMAHALHGLGRVAEGQGDYVSARPLFEESLTIIRERGDRRGMAVAFIDLAWVAQEQGDYAAARSLAEESLAICRELGDTRLVGATLHVLSWVAKGEGDYAVAQSLLEESVAIFRKVGDQRAMADCFRGLGLVAEGRGNYPEAQRLYEESLEIFRELGDRRGMALSLKGIGDVAALQGDYPTARSLYDESLRISVAMGSKRNIGWTLCSLGKVAEMEGDYDRAAPFCRQALVLLSELGVRDGVHACLAGCAKAAHARGQLARAARLYGAAEVLREAIGNSQTPSVLAEGDNTSALRVELGERALADAWAAGRAMTHAEAIRFALSGD